MKTGDVIKGLNKILACEYAGILQGLQHGYLVRGAEREYLRDFFRKRAQDALQGHARQLGEKLVALGGVPTVEPATIRQSTDTTEMLQQALAAERAAQDAQKELLAGVQDDVPLRVMLEDMILDEQREIEELEMLLAQKKAVVATKEIRLKESA